ncbi:MAG: hypothetical protein AAGC81_00515 [Pseudomonadota bacterium]
MSFESAFQDFQAEINAIQFEFDLLSPAWAYVSGIRSDGVQSERWTDGSGVLRRELLTDNQSNDGMGVKPWDWMLTSYREDGSKSLKYTQKTETTAFATLFEDDGSQTKVNFAANKVVISNFDASGTITARFIAYEDGRESQITYDENGVLRERLTLDGPLNDLGDAPDLTGDPPEPADNDGAFPWAQRLERFDASGTIEFKGTLFDDGDTEAIIFNDSGTRQEKQLIDQDFDQPWLARRVIFDETGKVEQRIDYSAEDGIPDDFIFADAFVDPGDAPVFEG